MAITFGYEFVVTKPLAGPVAEGFLPWAFAYSKEQFIQGISVVGAVIMPHNLYLHSSLVKVALVLSGIGRMEFFRAAQLIVQRQTVFEKPTNTFLSSLQLLSFARL